MDPMRLRLDPWPGDYDGAIQIEELEEPRAADVDTTVETSSWAAISGPSRASRPSSLAFVDGVRRIEARVIGEAGTGQLVYGMFGSIAVGAVEVDGQKARMDRGVVRRYLVLGSNQSAEPEAFRIGNTWVRFDPYSTVESGPSGPMLALQNLMRTEEALLAEAIEASGACVFADGPLTYFSGLKHRTVGMIKRLYQPYVPSSHFALLSQLQPGQRTPIFAILDGKYDRYAWYLRLARPRVLDHGAAGIIRLEMRTGLGIEEAVRSAGISAICLPAFASDPARDPRSPQNLLPVGALEQELRRRLGDAMAIRRGIEQRLFERVEA
jgi:hypothetical protein